MNTLQLLIGFIVYTALWMVFSYVMIAISKNLPVFGKGKKEEDFSDLEGLSQNELQRMMQQRFGSPHTFDMPKKEEEPVDPNTGFFTDGFEPNQPHGQEEVS
jgi:hypothetical protein